MRINPKIILAFAAATTTVSADFIENWDGSSSSEFYFGTGTASQSRVLYGTDNEDADDGKVLTLQLDANAIAGPWNGPNMATNDQMQYGTYACRIKVPDVTAQPNVGCVTGFYTYFNNGSDENGNGIGDNSEIDFEWLIADPSIIYMTMWTDYQESPTTALRKVSRIINLASGTIYENRYETNFGVGDDLNSEAETTPSTLTAIPGYNASSQFYTYGFDWLETGVRWWIINPANEDTVVLWNYKGPSERITHRAAALMVNLWHTNNWPVYSNNNSTEAPANRLEALVDWTSYSAPSSTPLTVTASAIHPKSSAVVKNNILNITMHGSGAKGIVELFDAQGKCVAKQNSAGGSGAASLSLKGLASGTYLWNLTSGKISEKGSFVYLP